MTTAQVKKDATAFLLVEEEIAFCLTRAQEHLQQAHRARVQRAFNRELGDVRYWLARAAKALDEVKL